MSLRDDAAEDKEYAELLQLRNLCNCVKELLQDINAWDDKVHILPDALRARVARELEEL